MCLTLKTKTLTPLQIENKQAKGLLSKAIGSIIRKNDHEIWITCLGGLAIYDTKTKGCNMAEAQQQCSE